MSKYVVYHDDEIGKVGCTSDPETRMEDQQGLTPWQDHVIDITNDRLTASHLEAYHKGRLGYKWDGDIYYKEDKHMYEVKKTPTAKYYSDKSTKLNELEDNYANGVTFTDGTEEFVFLPHQVKYLLRIAQESFKTSGIYFVPRAVKNLYRNLDMLEEEVLSIPGATVTVQRQQNNCSGLEIEKTGATLDDVFELQLSLQKKFPETADIGNQTLADTALAAQRNMHAFTDEVMEFMDAIGGINDGIKNGAWKYWKQDYQLAKERYISDLSPEDLLELKFEFVDMFHFYINWGLMIGMTGQELIDMYVAKNKENFERQKRGY